MSEKNESNLQHEFKKSLIDTISTLNEISKNINDNLPNENSIKSENNGEQISLLDIDENEKRDNLDDVLEIPAFLRRQAN